MSSDEESGELGGCELGTSVYWDKVYNSEMANYKRHGDVGEIWFGEDSMMRIVRWFLNSALVEKSDPIIDLGCGNGMTLIELSKEGFSSLLGVDYSDSAIRLAATVAEEHSYDIKYEVLDILNQDIDKHAGKFKIVHDKGTYDAVSLNPEDTKTKRLTYIDKAADLLITGGLFVITSCNWTEQELVEHFKHKFQMKKVLPTPQFQFGGKVGNVITSMIFEKINL